MVGSDSTPGPLGAPMSAGSAWPQAPCTLHPVSTVGSGQSGVGMGTISGHFKDTKRWRCPKLIWGHWHGQNEGHVSKLREGGW